MKGGWGDFIFRVLLGKIRDCANFSNTPRIKMSQGKHRLFRVLMIAGTFVFCLALMELLVRTFDPQSTQRWTDLFFLYDPDLGETGIPNKKGRFASHSFNTEVSLNDEGFRDADHGLRNDSGKYRIVNLGDSFTWGHGVEIDEAYVKVLERLDPNIETVNMGGLGRDPQGELLVYLTRALKYDQNLVMMGFYLGNDLAPKFPDANTSPPRFGYNEDGFLDYIGARKTPEEVRAIRIKQEEKFAPNKYRRWDKRVHYWFIRNFHSYTYLDNLQDHFAEIVKSSVAYNRAAKWLGKENRRGYGFLNYCLKQEPEAIRRNWKLLEDILRTLKHFTEHSGAELFLVFIPHVVQTSDPVYRRTLNRLGIDNPDLFDLGQPNRKLAALCDKLDIGHIDLLPAMIEETKRRGLLYFRRDPHWTAEGHRIAGEAIYESIKNQGILN